MSWFSRLLGIDLLSKSITSLSDKVEVLIAAHAASTSRIITLEERSDHDKKIHLNWMAVQLRLQPIYPELVSESRNPAIPHQSSVALPALEEALVKATGDNNAMDAFIKHAMEVIQEDQDLDIQ